MVQPSLPKGPVARKLGARDLGNGLVHLAMPAGLLDPCAIQVAPDVEVRILDPDRVM